MTKMNDVTKELETETMRLLGALMASEYAPKHGAEQDAVRVLQAEGAWGELGVGAKLAILHDAWVWALNTWIGTHESEEQEKLLKTLSNGYSYDVDSIAMDCRIKSVELPSILKEATMFLSRNLEEMVFRNELTPQEVEDLLVTSLEGGSTYWMDRVELVGGKIPGLKFYESFAQGRQLTVWVKDDSKARSTSEESYTLTREKLVRGALCRAVRKKKTLHAWVTSGPDADEADAAVQWGLFKEHMYG